ncbi:MAG: YibE/F family protein [Defluviitaleaceae bacterium]|nr:YibE/F family protein [Defluviitaleaceae bacterium]
MENRIIKILPYVVILVLSLVFLYVGNRIAVRGVADNEVTQFYEARVRVVVSVEDHSTAFEEWQTIMFEAEILRGERRGERVTFMQNTRGHFFERFPRVAEVGDRVILGEGAQGAWSFIDYVRIYGIMILGGIFVILLIIFGRVKGFNSILSLGLTCTAIFGVFIPSIISGMNIYISAIIVCIYSIVTTIFIINGFNRKSIAAVAGCLGGVLIAGILTLIMNRALELTGITQSESIHLITLFENPIDLNAIIFAGIIIGATGAIMDIAISISSALWEVKAQAPQTTFSDLFKSGINIGKDILGSSINTLVLAYIGSSLTVILILLGWGVSLFRLMNRELVIVELLQAIAGSFGIFFAMPLTALICAVLFAEKPQFTAPSYPDYPDYPDPFD